ncbi:MAG: MBL fold metallo-hydrolase [Anaerolineae bacterium]|nr:MBL fold metallo-hydrolase [Anaerolineae bacterium]
MRLTFYGAAQTVTGSQHLVEVNGQRILLDCGLYQGKRSESTERNRNLPFDASKIDVLVLSHAHIDHSGNIPNLVKSGFRGDIVCTHATRDLCAVMLMDSGHIQERDVEFVNKKNAKRGLPPVEPIYTQEDAAASLDYFTSQGYSRPRRIAPGILVTFIDAGHMLGSASVILDIEDQDSRKDVRLVFSGDIGRKGIPIIRDPQLPDSADILIMESTYGNRSHDPATDMSKEVERIINTTYRRGGKIIVPAFAVGRTQQLVFMLNEMAAKGDIPRLPIYVDSPLAVNTTDVFRSHPECFDAETRQFINESGSKRDPFGFANLHYTRSVEDSKQLNFMREPAIIISASGMAETGRILHHLKNNIEDSRTTVLIVGWQAPDTLGRRLVDGEKVVSIFGEKYHNNAQVVVLNGLSGHADQNELSAWVEAMQRKPRRVFLVHGELEASNALAGRLRDRFNLQVDIPAWKQAYDVRGTGYEQPGLM